MVEEVSKIHSTLGQLLTRVTSLEESSIKHQMLIDQLTQKYYSSGSPSRVRHLPLIREGTSSSKGAVEKYIKHVSRKRAKPQGTRKIGVSSKMEAKRNFKKSTILQKGKSIPTAKPIVRRSDVVVLSSSEIDTSSLISIDSILSKYRHYIAEGNVKCLTRRLAAEAVIGRDVLLRCTAKGCKNGYPSLPTDALYVIKQTILNVFPCYWTNPVKFEKVWNRECIEGIQALCSEERFRLNQQHPSTSCPTVRSPRPNGKVALPSSKIDKSKLISLNKFMSMNSELIKSNEYTLYYWSRRLALEVYFGSDILRRCSVSGRNGHLCLPTHEFIQFKQAVFKCCPSIWNNPDEFERKWSKCTTSNLNRLCDNLRK